MRNVRQYLWSILGRFLPSFIFLAASFVLARILTPNDFGLVGVLAILFTVASALTDAGLGGSLIKEKTITDTDCSTIFNFNIVISLILYVILFFTAPWIEEYYNLDNLSMVARLLSISFVINAFSLVPRALMMRRLQFKELFEVSVLSTLSGALISIVCAFWGMGVYALVVYYLCSYATTSVMCLFWGRFRYYPVFSKASFQRMISFGIFTSISTVIDTVYENLLSAMYGKVWGVTTAGYFYQAKKTEEAVTTALASSVGLVAFPVLADLQDDKARFTSEMRSIMLSITGVLVPLVLLLSVYANEIIVLLYGVQWIDSAIYLKLLLFAGCFMIMENLNRSVIKSLGLGDMLLKVALIKRGLGITILFIMIFVDKTLLVHAYILCSFMGYLINQIALSNHTGTSAVKEMLLLFKVLIPSVGLFLLFCVIHVWTNILAVELILDAAALALYYNVYLPIIDVNLMIELTKGLWPKFKRNNNVR